MDEQEQVLKEIQDHIAALPEEERRAVNSFAGTFRLLLGQRGDMLGTLARLAFALVGAEEAAKE